jgi:uncharacterized protein YjbI with pentapeptide repeats
MADLTSWDKSGFLGNILAEAHGVLFDIFIFGILIVIYDKLIIERRRKVEKYNEEIDNYRRWEEPEAAHRIANLTKKLSKLGVTEIDLSDCYLAGMNLGGINLRKANLRSSILRGTYLKFADLQGADLSYANLEESQISDAAFAGANLYYAILRKSKGGGEGEGTFSNANLELADLEEVSLNEFRFLKAKMHGAKLVGSYLKWCMFNGADLSAVNLSNSRIIGSTFTSAIMKIANLKGAILRTEIEEHRYGSDTILINTFKDANLTGADLSETDMDGVDLTGAILKEANFLGSKNLVLDQLAKAKTLYGAKLDGEIEAQIREKFPRLLLNVE